MSIYIYIYIERESVAYIYIYIHTILYNDVYIHHMSHCTCIYICPYIYTYLKIDTHIYI